MKIVRLLFLAAFAFVVSVPVPASSQSIAFTNVRIVDGNGGTPIEHGTIVVEGKKIVAVGPSSGVTIPDGVRRVDEGGKTAMPGLADMHVHLTGGWDGVSADLLGYQLYMNSLLYAGVTTVLDTGDVEPYILQLRQEIAAGRVLGPRIYCVGPLVDGPDPFWPPISRAVVSVDQVPTLVKQLAAEKVDLIKLYAGLSDAEILAISTEAKKYNLRTIIDVHRRNGSIDVMQEGISGWAHLPSHRISDDAIETAKEHRIFFITTLTVLEMFTHRRFEDVSFLDDPLIADTTPPYVLKEMREQASLRQVKKQWLTMFSGAESNVKRIEDAGIIMAAGTDAPYPGDFQGEGVHHELDLLVESGLTPLQAITIGTKNAALIMNDGAEWGTLEQGKLANIVIVNGKPDQNIHDTYKIAVVMKEGKVLDRNKLKLTPATDPGYRPVGGLPSD
jgi:imidazolonepropionase-like amidohydrolase